MDLPATVVRAIDRYRAIDAAIRAIGGDPLAGLDLATVEPTDAEALVQRVNRADIAASFAHSPSTIRLRALANRAAVQSIAFCGKEIIAALRPIHDQLAEQIARGSLLLQGISEAGLVAASQEVRSAWVDRPTLLRTMRDVRRARNELGDAGYRLGLRDQLGRQLESLTTYVNVPPDVTPSQLITWFDLVEQHAYEGVLADSGEWWLPGLDEQRDRVQELRVVWANRRSARTP